jgi:hypothetical protein
MPFTLRPYQRFPVLCPVTYHAGLFQGHGTVRNFSLNGWRLSGDVPLRIGQPCSMMVTLPNEQGLFAVAAIVRWKRGEEYGLETLVMEKQTQSRLEHYIKRLVQTETNAETLRQVRPPV